MPRFQPRRILACTKRVLIPRMSNRAAATLARERVTALGVVAPPPIQVTTPTFDGSLAQLFQCVRDRKIELRDVPLLPICEAYFAYLLSASLQHLDEAAAALTALAYLLERKAWLLLPVDEPEPEQENPLELPEPTVHEFDAAIEALERWRHERSHQFFRAAGIGPDPYEVPFELGDLALPDLAKAFERLLSKASPEPVNSLAKPRRSLADQMAQVLNALSNLPQTLDQLIPHPFTRTDAVLWFLALLELIRLGQVAVQVGEDDVLFSRPR